MPRLSSLSIPEPVYEFLETWEMVPEQLGMPGKRFQSPPPPILRFPSRPFSGTIER